MTAITITRPTIVRTRLPPLTPSPPTPAACEASTFGALSGRLSGVDSPSAACEAAGVSDTNVYQRRKVDAAFRAGWLEAIATAYQRLELVLIERALNGTEKIVTKADGREERMREYPNQIALTLLRMHRDTAAEAQTEVPIEDVEEIRKRLLGKLQRLRKREEEKAAAGGAGPQTGGTQTAGGGPRPEGAGGGDEVIDAEFRENK